MKYAVYIGLLLLLASVASAQVILTEQELLETECGDGVREGFEMCEPETEFDFCEAAGKVLGIVMVCSEKTCDCLPTRKDCGNQIREGTEYCDPGKKETPEENDFCDELSDVINQTVLCDPASCFCKPEKPYITPATCGDGKIEKDEECEEDKDCIAGFDCKECKCVERPKPKDGEVEEVEPEEILEQIPLTEEKKHPKDYQLDDYVGVNLYPILERDFEDEIINLEYKYENESVVTIGIMTQHGVVQATQAEPYDKPSFLAWIKDETYQGIVNSENISQAIETAIETDELKYRPRNFFRRIGFWFKTLFR